MMDRVPGGHPFLRGLLCLCLTIATTALVPWILLPRDADWVGLGIPQVVLTMVALAVLTAGPLLLVRLVDLLRTRPAMPPAVLLVASEGGEVDAQQREGGGTP